MDETPLVSVVTPTLNQARFLERTITSIRGQTYSRLEHIVIDGGSTDGTLEILRRQEGSYPLRWLSERDQGMYEAVNKGMALANGQLLAYLNGDDLYFPWTLATVVERFRHSPDVDFVFGDALNIDDATGVVRPYWNLPFDLDYVRRFGFLAQPAVFWRRSAFECEGPFDESLRYVADCDMWMRAGAHHRFAKVDEFLAVERDHPAAQRLSTGGAVWTELASVRARYGSGSTAARLKQRIRRGLWTRFYTLRLLVKAVTPGDPTGAWSQLLRTRSLQAHALPILMGIVPKLGARFGNQAFEPSRRWLEPILD